MIEIFDKEKIRCVQLNNRQGYGEFRSLKMERKEKKDFFSANALKKKNIYFEYEQQVSLDRETIGCVQLDVHERECRIYSSKNICQIVAS